MIHVCNCKEEGCNAEVLAERGYCSRHGGPKRHHREQLAAEAEAKREKAKARRKLVRTREQAKKAAVNARGLKVKVKKGQRHSGTSRGGEPMTGLKALARLDWLRHQAAAVQA